MALNGIMNRKYLYSQSGQVGLIVLLVMVVLVTVAISIASRSVSELRLERQETESTRSLNLAESGIEELLAEDLSGLITDTSTMTGSDSRIISGQQIDYFIKGDAALVGIPVVRGHTIDVNLNGATGTDLLIDWDESCEAPNNSAVVVAIINSDFTVQREILSKCEVAGDGITNTTAKVGTGPFTVNFDPSVSRMARIKALYQLATISAGAGTGTTLPVQLYTVRTSARLADGTTRAVEVTKANASLPGIFDYVLFSGSSLNKN